MNRPAAKRATTITVHLPMTFTIRGGRKTIISEPANGTRGAVQDERDRVRSFPRTHNALIKALARAHRWRRMIEGGEHGSITELAEGEKVNDSYACRLLRLTLLAPAIVAQILDGHCESNLMLKKLMKPLPIRWDEQATALKIRLDMAPEVSTK